MGDMSDLMDYLYDDIDTFCMGDYWEEGKHRTKNGGILEIKDMETSHIINTINYFSNFNTKPLEKELKKRGIKFTKKTKSKFKPYNSVIQTYPVCGK